MHNITPAQIRVLEKLTRGFPHNQEFRLAPRYTSHSVILYTDIFRIAIWPNGNWEVREKSGNKLIEKGEYDLG